jgi:hypothetical protein
MEKEESIVKTPWEKPEIVSVDEKVLLASVEAFGCSDNCGGNGPPP